MTGLRALLPVKPFALGKTRLAPVLSLAERISICRRLYVRALDTLCRFPGAGATAVVTGDDEARGLARSRGLLVLPDHGGGDLNRALTAAIGDIGSLQESFDAVLIIPADLPRVAPEDIRMLAEACPDRGIAIAPDRRREGTNGLVIRPPQLIPMAFGACSYGKHSVQAKRFGGAVQVVCNGNLAFDVDNPADLIELW